MTIFVVVALLSNWFKDFYKEKNIPQPELKYIIWSINLANISLEFVRNTNQITNVSVFTVLCCCIWQLSDRNPGALGDREFRVNQSLSTSLWDSLSATYVQCPGWPRIIHNNAWYLYTSVNTYEQNRTYVYFNIKHT